MRSQETILGVVIDVSVFVKKGYSFFFVRIFHDNRAVYSLKLKLPGIHGSFLE
ncbi:hypothetical protein [Nitrosomonas sp. Is79A3]|uniref:hypothetical protein n=1 Tax=Nitrosomonas sp. (strain Is79A3) TaxID=261292 RepID=UPI0002E10930